MVKEYGYEYDAVLDKELWQKYGGTCIDKKMLAAYCLRSGRDALKAIAREYEPCVALLPSLACDSMVMPFEQFGHKIRFYKLDKDYSIDFENLKQCIGKERTLFLYMDYFGKNSISDCKLESLRSLGNIVFIEDRTHNLIWERENTFQPEYVMASLRKWLPIPDGGLLWGQISKPLQNDISFSTTRLRAQNLRHEYLNYGDESIKTEFRKIFSTVSDIMNHDNPSAMSAYAYAIANNTDWDEIRRIRKNNANVLISVLSRSPYIKFIQDRVGFSDLYVAFVVPNRDEVQRRLSAEGIFNTIIWPLSDIQKNVCQVAKSTEENMLAAPCDQRYDTNDMKFIGEEIVRVIADVNK